jgi:hypothetical protein
MSTVIFAKIPIIITFVSRINIHSSLRVGNRGFKRGQQIIRAVGIESAVVRLTVYQTKFGDKAVVQVVKIRLLRLDFSVAMLVKL